MPCLQHGIYLMIFKYDIFMNDISRKDILPENENFPLTYDGLKENKVFLKIQREAGNPNYKYKGNCTKKFAEAIVDKYLDREYEWVKSHPLPSVNEKEPSRSVYENEISTLVNHQRNWKTKSPIIKYFHKSFLDAAKKKHASPNTGWKILQNNKEIFRKFYLNRLRCSDWFNEHKKNEPFDIHWKYLLEGKVPPFIYAIGLTTSGKYMNVGLFKPHAARYLVDKYLKDFNEVFDPFSGFSGRLLGTIALGKKYIGRDLSKRVIEESKELMDFAKPIFEKNGIIPQYDLANADATKNTGTYECLLTCPPYGNTEIWDGVPESNISCDDWIETCLKNYKCKRYVFVVDGSIVKYKNFVKETFTNTCHWGKNDEYIVVINESDKI